MITLNLPLLVPPAAAVKVKLSVVAEPAGAVTGDTVIVPDPSGEAWTATWGEEEMAVRMPVAVDFSLVEKIAVPMLAGAMALLAPPPEP
jgi:hypothetical protein